MNSFRNIRDEGIQKVANGAARLLLFPSDGYIVEQLDDNSLWAWNQASATWVSTGGGGGSGVSSLNSLNGALDLVAGTGITITPSGTNITITSTGAAGSYFVNEFTLSPTDITNKYVTLSQAPDVPQHTVLNIVGGIVQAYTTDFTVTGTQLNWNSLGLDGVLASGDQLIVQFN